MTDFSESMINEVMDSSNPNYTSRELQLRKKFCQEYLLDYDATKAAIRCGFAATYATNYAVKFMEEPFVQQEIKRLEKKSGASESIDDADAVAIIKSSLFREAHFKGEGSSHSARVSALAKLAAIHGMEAPTKIEQTTTHKGGVMLIPAIPTVAEYERNAIQQQAQLMRDASL